MLLAMTQNTTQSRTSSNQNDFLTLMDVTEHQIECIWLHLALVRTWNILLINSGKLIFVSHFDKGPHKH